MPIPANLWRFAITGGHAEDPDEFFSPLLWEWTLVWHCQLTPDDAFGFNGEQTAVHLRDRLGNVGVQPQFRPFGRHQVVRRTDRAKVDGSFSGSTLENFILNPGNNVPSAAPQTALLVVGRTNALGTQTRKWISGLRRDLLGDPVPRWFAPGAAQQLVAWAWQQLQDFQFVDVITGNPVEVEHVCWDEVNEVTHPVTKILMQSWPRTQRRRSNAADPIWFEAP